MHFLEREGRDNWLGQNVHVHEKARLERCVLMDGAEVTSPIRLSSCVLFPGVQVNGDRGLKHAIVTPDALIQCEE